MSLSTRWRAWCVVGLLLTIGMVGFLSIPKAERAPPRPSYGGQDLLYWLVAEPQLPVSSAEDTRQFRGEALRAMGQPAVDYLRWAIRNPKSSLEEPLTSLERFSSVLDRLTRSSASVPQQPKTSLGSIVPALELLGPMASSAAPDLLRLWDHARGSGAYQYYNGFPLALAAFNDASPEVIAALHQRFSSPNRLHRALCAFAAWRLMPSDTEAVALIRAELNATDPEDHPRFALLDTLSTLGGKSGTFATEIKGLVDRSTKAETYKRALVARGEWRILRSDQSAEKLLGELAAEMEGPNCPKENADTFVAAAVQLEEIPSACDRSIPILKRLSKHPDESAARFASGVLSRMQKKDSTANPRE